MTVKVEPLGDGKYIARAPSNEVATVIQAIEMRDYFQFVYSRFKKQIENDSLAYDLERYGNDGHDQKDVVWICRNMASLLSSSDVILWDRDMWNVAFKGHESLIGSIPSPDWVLPREAGPPRYQLWFLRNSPQGWGVDSELMVLARLVFPAMGLETNRPVLYAADIIMTKDRRQFLCNYTVPLDEPIKTSDTPLVATFAFLSLPIPFKEREMPSRQYRRQSERQGIELPTVYTVKLRRTAGTKSRSDSDGNREYHCHWLNGAHWRNQWYPSKGTHSPIFILPYVKGDQSKPFKPPSQKVFRVVR